MATNRDWLFGLPLDEQYAWMNAEHVESPTSRETAQDGQVHQKSGERALESVTAALNAKIDSREKLEVDVSKYLDYPHDCRAVYDYNAVIGWLDRQAAITEREILCHPDERDEQIAELTAERDKLKELNGYHAVQYELASEDCDRLQAQVDKLTAEREQYRNLFGMALDWAHEITMLETSIDEGLA